MSPHKALCQNGGLCGGIPAVSGLFGAVLGAPLPLPAVWSSCPPIISRLPAPGQPRPGSRHWPRVNSPHTANCPIPVVRLPLNWLPLEPRVSTRLVNPGLPVPDTQGSWTRPDHRAMLGTQEVWAGSNPQVYSQGSIGRNAPMTSSPRSSWSSSQSTHVIHVITAPDLLHQAKQKGVCLTQKLS